MVDVASMLGVGRNAANAFMARAYELAEALDGLKQADIDVDGDAPTLVIEAATSYTTTPWGKGQPA